MISKYFGYQLRKSLTKSLSTLRNKYYSFCSTPSMTEE